MKTLHRFLILLCVSAVSPLAAATPVPDEPDGTVNAAALAQAVESTFQIELGGRLQIDASVPLEREPFGGGFGSLETGVEVRRGRLHAIGRMYDRIDFKLEVDFAGGDASAKDFWIGVRDLPVGTRFGHFKEPFSLEELTSSRFTTFMERSLINGLAPSRNLGIRLDGDLAEGRGTWTVGAFRDSDELTPVDGSNYGLSGRLTYLPVHEREGRRLLHVGVSATRRWMEGNFRLGARPGDHLAPRLLSVALPAEHATILQLEAATNLDSLSLQGEWVTSSVDAIDGAGRGVDGFYVQGSWFLTGEHRPYDGGVFRRVVPAANLDEGGGAWQLAARYARLDATEIEPDAELWALTVGVNWYWFSHFRWMFGYERAGGPSDDGSAYSSVHLRAALDF